MILRINKIYIILMLALLVHGAAFGQECNNNMPVVTPNERFEDQGNGTVMDKNTSLVWKRCSEGQTYNSQSRNCEGEARLFVPNEALAFEENINNNGFAGHTDWRVPNVKELSSIVEPSCVNPAINIVIFRNTPSDHFWSSTPSGYQYYYCVNFGNGEVNRDCVINNAGGGMGGAIEVPEAYLRFVRN